MSDNCEPPSENLTRLSVRALVELVFRAGDIQSGFQSPKRALEGARAHRRLQKTRPPDYRAEVTLEGRISLDDEEAGIVLFGRADGIFEKTPTPVIEEIKSTTRPLSDIEEVDNPHYWAQAKLYALMYAEALALDSIEVQLTYIRLPSDETKSFAQSFTKEALEAFARQLLAKLTKRFARLQSLKRNRDRSIGALAFPFKHYRKGQKEMAVTVYNTVTKGQNLFLQAPTGIGKTMGVLFPLMKRLGEGHYEKLFYLTAKSVGRYAAIDAISLLRTKGLEAKSVALMAKEKICFQETPACDAKLCPYAKGHYDRVDEALDSLLETDAIEAEIVQKVAKAHRVCPFELLLDATLYADIIICDYNYAFDPNVQLKRFFAEESPSFVMAIDEAHNLPDRARAMFSAELKKSDVLQAKRAMASEWKAGARLAATLDKAMLTMRKAMEDKRISEQVLDEKPKEILKAAKAFLQRVEERLAKAKATEVSDEVIELYFTLRRFLKAAELFDRRYVAYQERIGKSELRLKLFCRDPSKLLKKTLGKTKAAIFFSATLSPLEYFRQISGGGKNDRLVRLASPFPPERFLPILHQGIITTYKKRDETMGDVADAIAKAVRVHKGKTLVFFPSYRYMQKVHEHFLSLVDEDEMEFIIQSPKMTETERARFLEAFEQESRGPLVAFAVMGGLFAEGIDLVGERLTGVIVVGVGLPMVCLERNEIRRFHDDNGEDGFAFAYQFPGLNRVLQAAGRVIRTENDFGYACLLDARFCQSRYRRLLPSGWQVKRVQKSEAIQALLAQFFLRLSP